MNLIITKCMWCPENMRECFNLPRLEIGRIEGKIWEFFKDGLWKMSKHSPVRKEREGIIGVHNSIGKD